MIGHAHIYLVGLYHLLNNETDYTPVLSDKGEFIGEIKVGIYPKIEGINIENYDDLNELEGKTI